MIKPYNLYYYNLVDYIGGFDSVNVVANSEQSTVVPRNNHHIRLEPLYATNY